MANRLLRAALIVLAWAAIAGSIWVLHQRVPAAPPLTTAEFTAGTEQLPRADAVWYPVTLPHVWSQAGSADATDGWYRLSPVPASDARTARAVLLWQVSMDARVYADSEPLGVSRPENPPTRNLYRPLYRALPPADGQGRELLVHVRADPRGSGFLGPVYVGPAEMLAPAWRTRLFVKSTALHLGSMLMIAIVLPMFVLGYLRREDNIYTWFAAFGVLIAAAPLTFSLQSLPLPALACDWVLMVLVSGFIYCVTVFVHRFVDVERPRLERRLLVAAVIGNALTGLAALQGPGLYYPLGFGLWAPLVVGWAVYPGWLILTRYWLRPLTGGFWLMIAGTMLLVLGARDVLVLNRWINPMDGIWVFYSAPLAMVVFSFILLQRFHHALREAEVLNRELADRVCQKEREIEASYAAVRQTEHARVLATERERILGDMHDGLGGLLISTLARLQLSGAGESAPARSLRAALDDLRLMLYSLEPSAASLRAALSLLRQRFEDQCADAGLQLDWDAQTLPEALNLGRRETLQLLRILQEALANTIKHAGATRFAVRAAVESRSLLVEARDDGSGYRAQPHVSGFGSRNMRSRAEDLGAQLTVASDGSGTCVSLRLPLPLPEAS